MLLPLPLVRWILPERESARRLSYAIDVGVLHEEASLGWFALQLDRVERSIGKQSRIGEGSAGFLQAATLPLQGVGVRIRGHLNRQPMGLQPVPHGSGQRMK
jgi:hypothetical protein